MSSAPLVSVLVAVVERADVACDQHISERGCDHPLCQLYAFAIDRDHLILQSVLTQLEAIRPKGIGNNQLGARLDIRTVDVSHCRRICEIKFIKTLVKADPARVKHRSHGTVNEERGSFKKFQKFLLHVYLC